MELQSQIDKAFATYDASRRMDAADLYESAIFRLLLKQLAALNWPSYVFNAMFMLENPSAAYHFLLKDAPGLARLFNCHPAVNGEHFSKFLDMCEGFYSADESAMRVLHCPDVEQFSTERRRRFC
jgi:hypothetical protein